MGDRPLLLHNLGGAVHRGAAATHYQWPNGRNSLPLPQQALHCICRTTVLGGTKLSVSAVRQQRPADGADVRPLQLLHSRQLLHNIQIKVPPGLDADGPGASGALHDDAGAAAGVDAPLRPHRDAPPDVPVAGRAALREDGDAPDAGARVRAALQPRPPHLHGRPRHRLLARVDFVALGHQRLRPDSQVHAVRADSHHLH
mmetsp:Transcript_21730/g.47723  ORF Transcript_21730/g.47723 Transcript_21730/m.47723 type:complete len:200 (-) Transcript_21730:776-1375(-)